jgi:hypothetical protein
MINDIDTVISMKGSSYSAARLRIFSVNNLMEKLCSNSIVNARDPFQRENEWDFNTLDVP